ncbi:MAG: hypothetical protein OEY19_11605 [Gammaproteobacteria bacterium]|nr:hypothetical protein [Gammaproteobacteria bacterium]MDH5628790.1 hypothetical protein [Gammaproteobacteria bacterium]
MRNFEGAKASSYKIFSIVVLFIFSGCLLAEDELGKNKSYISEVEFNLEYFVLLNFFSIHDELQAEQGDFLEVILDEISICKDVNKSELIKGMRELTKNSKNSKEFARQIIKLKERKQC